MTIDVLSGTFEPREAGKETWKGGLLSRFTQLCYFQLRAKGVGWLKTGRIHNVPNQHSSQTGPNFVALAF